nr:hypothetical protein 18 [bacterium]
MRARNIKPGFYKNEDLVECSFAARLLAPGLWQMADREGRLEYRPKRIKMEIFPADNLDIEPLIQELHDAGHIVCYEVDGKKYIQVLEFSKHQTPHIKEKPSEIPPYQEKDSGASTRQAPDKPDTGTDLGECQHPLNPESLILNPELPPLTPPRGKKRRPDPDFEKFWKTFPKDRIGSKQKAMSAYRKARARASPDEIQRGVEAYSQSDEVQRGYAKGAAAWLNDERWRIDYATLDEKRDANPRKDTRLEEFDRMMAQENQP